jgi:hypothetical protein
LNLAIGGGFFNGYPALTSADVQAWTNPSFIVDYVRVYARSTDTQPTGAGTTQPGTTTGGGSTSTIGSGTSTTGKSTTGGAADLIGNQNQSNSVAGMTDKQVKLYFYIAIGCSIGSVALLAIGVAMFAVMWKKQRSSGSTASASASIGFH